MKAEDVRKMRDAADVFAGLRRVGRQRHAARFLASQTLYLAAATADGANATLFAQEVVGLAVARITLLTIYAAFAGERAGRRAR